MQSLPIRLQPGDDLRRAIEAAVVSQGQGAGAFVLAGIGSLSGASLRLAGAEQVLKLEGDLEILTLAGSVSVDGSHLHMSVADAQGRVWGGHVTPGCMVRTTAEVLLALLPEWQLARAFDAATGYAELLVGRTPGANDRRARLTLRAEGPHELLCWTASNGHHRMSQPRRHTRPAPPAPAPAAEAAPPLAPIKPVQQKIGEGAGNLRAREAAFKRRHEPR